MQDEVPTYPRASTRSLIQAFRIEGLYGYRNISLSSEHAATILIAKNGSGKTTLLAALDAFLRCQFSRLRDLEFSRIVCKLRSVDEDLILNKSDISQLFEGDISVEIERLARRSELDPKDVLSFLERDFSTDPDALEEIDDSKVFTSILRTSGYSRKAAVETCQRIRSSYYEANPNVWKIFSAVSIALDGIDIVYLPTYRRIELPMAQQPDRERSTYRPKRIGFRFIDKGLYAGRIQFGLEDVSSRLAQLNQRLQSTSNIRYREISANIINELLDGTFDRQEYHDEDLPVREELELFFARLKDSRQHRIGPFSEVTIPNIDKIYSGDGISDSSNTFLTYFLSKLNASIKATRDIEVMAEDFISVCNKYLSAIDPSTDSPEVIDQNRQDVDAKNFD